METSEIIFTVIYFAILALYLYAGSSSNKVFRIGTKAALASTYLIYAIVIASVNMLGDGRSLLFLLGLFFLYLGDIILPFYFNHGADMFLAGNITLILYQNFLVAWNGGNFFPQLYFLLPSYLIIVALILYAVYGKEKIFEIKGMKVPVVIYLCTVGLTCFSGINLLCIYHSSLAGLFGLGSILFFLSDIVLCLDKFRSPRKWFMKPLNSALYFTGIYLYVLFFFRMFA